MAQSVDSRIFLPRSTSVATVEYAGTQAVAIVLNLTDLDGNDEAFVVLFDSEDVAAFGGDILNRAMDVPSFAEQQAEPATVEADTESEEDAQK